MTSPVPPVVLRPVSLPRAQVELACWDTGGAGTPIVLLHAAWGSAEFWAPQLHSLSAAGHRVIAWSRRGHLGSSVGPADPGSVPTDLDELADVLGLGTFHLVGTAYGGFGALDYALLHPARLHTLTIAASIAGITDPDWVADTARLVPPVWEELPVELRELSAAYRYADPAGTRRWTELIARAVHTRVHQRPTATVTRAALRSLAVPTLLLTGDADPYLPPPRMAELAALVPGARTAVIERSGHSPAWENPAQFDAAVLALIGSTEVGRGR